MLWNVNERLNLESGVRGSTIIAANSNGTLVSILTRLYNLQEVKMGLLLALNS